MNEVEVPEGSVFTYRLSNGTHVLIHQSSIEQSKGTEEVDCDEEVPLLFLEDGQITCNGIEVTVPLICDIYYHVFSLLLFESINECKPIYVLYDFGRL